MSTGLTTNNAMLLPVGSLEAFVSRAFDTPILTLEQEQALAKRLKNEGDLQAARQLILAHLRYVIRIAKGYSGYGLPLSDLIQEGNIGLMKAVKRFDPAKGVRLVSFAVHWIKAEIHEFILKNWRIVKVATTKAQRKLFFNLRQMKKRLGWFTKEEVAAVAEDLGVSTKEVLNMEERLNAQDYTYDLPTNDDEGFAPEQYLTHEADNPENQVVDEDTSSHEQLELREALAQLDPRSRDILTKRWLDDKKTTLTALSREYRVSAERIRQLEQNAITKLKDLLSETLFA